MSNNYQTDSVLEIQAIARNLTGKVANIEQMAAAHIRNGSSVADFRAAALSQLPEIRPMTRPILSDVPVREWSKFSVCRAIQAVDNGGLDGLEREISDEICIKSGKRAQGFWMPPLPETRNYVAGSGTLGGFAVATQNLGGEFIELLRNQPMVERLGARVLNLSNPVTIPRQAGAGVANWVGETVAATLSTGNFEQLTLTPYGVSAMQQYSKQLLYTSNPSIDLMVQNDIHAILNLAIDKAALHGTGSGQPTGIAATTGIGTVSVAMLAAASLGSSLYPFLCSLETAISTANADQGAVAFLMNSKTRSALKGTLKFAVNGSEPIWENPSTPGGFATVAGWRAEASNQIATNLTTGTATTICTVVFCGNWSELILAKFNGGAVDLVVDPYSLMQNGVVRIAARQWVDIGVRHAASFAMGGGILA